MILFADDEVRFISSERKGEEHLVWLEGGGGGGGERRNNLGPAIKL